jgi:hypothetical protein
LDLSKWKWEPPTLFSAREENRQEQQQLAEHWLGKWLILPPTAIETQTPEVPLPSTPLEYLDQFQSLVDTKPLYELIHACDVMCLQLRDDSEPLAPKEMLAESLGNILEALVERFGSSSDALTLFAQLYSAVVKRISMEDPGICQCLLTLLANLPAGDELCKLFELTMRSIAAEHYDAVSDQVLAILDKFFGLWNETPENVAGRQGQILGIANALCRLSSSKTPILRGAEQLLLEPSRPLEHRYHVRYAWLSVLARSQRLKFKNLLETFSILFGNTAAAAAVSNLDLCSLLLDHWISTGTIRHTDDIRSVIGELSSCGELTNIAALSLALYTLDAKWEARILDLCVLLKAAGRLRDLPISFWELSRHRKLHPPFLRTVAVASDDYRVALSLHNLYTETFKLQTKKAREKEKRTGGWRKRTWSTFLEQAVSDPSRDIADVTQLLGLCEPDKKTATIAAKLAHETAHSSTLPNRVALRRVTECVRFLQKSGNGLPPAALIAVYRVVTRDLADGDWGRTSRLDWFLSLVRRECGVHEAEQCKFLLQRWRELVHQFKLQQREQETVEENSLEDEK